MNFNSLVYHLITEQHVFERRINVLDRSFLFLRPSRFGNNDEGLATILQSIYCTNSLMRCIFTPRSLHKSGQIPRLAWISSLKFVFRRAWGLCANWKVSITNNCRPKSCHPHFSRRKAKDAHMIRAFAPHEDLWRFWGSFYSVSNRIRGRWR